MKKVIVGGVLAGLALFVWSAIAHEVLPLGTAGIRAMPTAPEPAVLDALRSAMNERALYIFPGIRPDMSEAEQASWMSRYLSGPAGVVAFDPHPGARAVGGSLFATLFATELLADILATLVAAFVILHVPASVGYGRRVLVTAALGFLVTLDVDVSYWNWYGFPTSYLLAQFAEHAVGWLLAGLVLARFCRRQA